MGDVVKLSDSEAGNQGGRNVARVLAAGGVAVFPTDTVYGIAQAVSANPSGPARLFQIKHRPAEKVVPWLVADERDLDRYGSDVPPYARLLARAFWPGPLTLVVHASAAVPAAYRAADGTVALRVPDAPFVRSLSSELGSPLATTSANTSGMPAPVSFDELEERIASEADVVVDGGATLDAEASTVVVCTGPSPRVARAGVIREDAILALCKNPAQGVRVPFSLPSSNGADTVVGDVWMPPANVELCGVVQLVHGMAEHIGRYDAFARELAARGCIVAGHDHLGHGRSASGPDGWGVLAPNAGADSLVEDVQKVRVLLDRRYPGLPHAVFGHSMGSFVARVFLGRYGEGLAGAVLCGTGWQPGVSLGAGRFLTSLVGRMRGWDYRSGLVDGLAVGSYARRFADQEGGEFAWLTRDADSRRAYADDPACGFVFSVGAYHELFRLVGMAQDRGLVSKTPKGLPVLLVSGSDDPVGSMGRAVPRVAALMRSCGMVDVEQKLYAGARHELLNETNRHEVMADVVDWLTRKGVLRGTR